MRARFIIAFFFYALVALLQVLLVRGENLPVAALRFAGLGLLIVPLWFLKTRNFSSKPTENKAPGKKAPRGRAPQGSDSNQNGAWMPAALTEVDRLRERLRSVRKVKIPFIHSKYFGILITFLFFFFFIFFAALVAGAVGFFVAIDLYLIFFPFLWFARLEKWLPAIADKIDVFGPVLKAELPKKLQLSPMLFFDENTHIPSDVRFMIAPALSVSQDLRDELLGAQIQLTYNNGPNGKVPYVYAVFITKGKGKIWQSLKNTKSAGFITEPGSSTEGAAVYGTVVLRLDTVSRSDGYHTRGKDVEQLLNLIVSALEKVCED